MGLPLLGLTALPLVDLPLWVLATGTVIIVATTTVAGHRLHRTLFYDLPVIGEYLPKDIGAWIGFVVGCITAYFSLAG
jgi:hypothetical protein